MYKALFVNLPDKFSVPEIVQSGACECEFAKKMPDFADIDQQLVVWYQPTPDWATIRKLRKNLGFADLRLVIWTDKADKAACRMATGAGADRLFELPYNEEELISQLMLLKQDLEGIYDYDKEMAEALVGAGTEALVTISALKAKHLHTSLRSNSLFYEEITAILPFLGQENGWLALTMNANDARHLAALLIDGDATALSDQELYQAFTELLQLTSRGLAARLPYDDLQMKPGMPFVAINNGLVLVTRRDLPVLTTVWKVEGRPLALRLGWLPVKKAAEGHIMAEDPGY